MSMTELKFVWIVVKVPNLYFWNHQGNGSRFCGEPAFFACIFLGIPEPMQVDGQRGKPLMFQHFPS